MDIFGIGQAVSGLLAMPFQHKQNVEQRKLVRHEGHQNRMQDQKNIEMQMQHNKEIAERNFQMENEMLDKMNEYNAPAQQMKRFKDAGLSPHLMYGQGTPGNQGQIAKYQEQATDMMNQRSGYEGSGAAAIVASQSMQQAYQTMQSGIHNYNQTRLMRAQARNLEADADLKRESLKFESFKNEPMHWRSRDGDDYHLSPNQIKVMQEMDIRLATEKNTRAQVIKAEKQIKQLGLQNEFLQYQNELKKFGVTPSDNVMIRMFIAMKGSGLSPQTLPNELKKATYKTLQEIMEKGQ